MINKSLDESSTEKYRKWLDTIDYKNVVFFGDRAFWAGVHPLMFHWSLVIGETHDKHSTLNHWCYETEASALQALILWAATSGGTFEGEPEGWHRHPATGRRRPGGDADKQYINW